MRRKLHPKVYRVSLIVRARQSKHPTRQYQLYCQENCLFPALLICKKLNLDPLGLISSGSLIITCNPKNTEKLINKISTSKINITKIGTMKNKNNGLKLYQNGEINKFPKFKRDEIARYFE